MSGYQVKQERVSIDGSDDLFIRSLLDRQQFFDPLGDAQCLGISSAAWPLFGLLWPSGLQLAARLAVRPVRSNERILEIGCGLALPSLVCHRKGADITASDYHPLAEAFLIENLRLNDLPAIKYRHGHWAHAEPPRARAGAPVPRAVLGQFDLIIGSDLLYERDESATLAGFIGRHAGPSAQVWIADPDRGNRPAFNRQMADQGFRLREEILYKPAVGGAAAYRGRMLIYGRSEEAFKSGRGSALPGG